MSNAQMLDQKLQYNVNNDKSPAFAQTIPLSEIVEKRAQLQKWLWIQSSTLEVTSKFLTAQKTRMDPLLYPWTPLSNQENKKKIRSP